MKIIFAGTSHGIPEKNAFCSSTFLSVGGNTYIIDAGAPVSALLRNYDLPHASVKGVFVTHFHGDHMAGLAEFCDQLTWYFKDSTPQIFLPEQDAVDLLHHWVKVLLPREEDRLSLNTYSDDFVFDDGVIRLSVRRTKHLANSFAFVIEAEGKRLLFTGDMSFHYSEYPELLRGEHFDLVVCEAAHHTEGEAGAVFKNTDTAQMVVNHVNPPKGKVLEEQIKAYAFPAQIAHDGLILTL